MIRRAAAASRQGINHMRQDTRPCFLCALIFWSAAMLSCGSGGGATTSTPLPPVGTPSEQLVIGGHTQSSTGFPLVNASRTTFAGGQEGALTAFNQGQTNYLFSTYVGGSGSQDTIRAMAFDLQGNIYVTGFTDSTNLQTTSGVFQPTYGGGATDCYVQKYSATGTLLASTYLGGNDAEFCYGLSLDSSNNVYVSGKTGSSNFPIVGNCFICSRPSVETWVIAKLNPSLTSILWSTYYGGTTYPTSNHDTARGRDFVDSSGNVYVEGNAGSSDFPTSPGAYQTTRKGPNDAAVVKFDTNGNRVWATLLGGANDTGNEGAFGGISVDSSGKVYVCGVTTASDFPTTAGAFQTTLKGGQDAFVTVIAADGRSLVASTFLGGTGTEACQGLALDSQGNVVVSTFTSSTDYPTTVGAFQTTLGGGLDIAVTKLSPTLASLVWSTYFGGNGTDGGDTLSVKLDLTDNVYFIFATTSTNLPVTPDAIQSTFGGGSSSGDMAIAELSSNGTSVLYCTYVGGSGDELGRDMTIRRTVVP